MGAVWFILGAIVGMSGLLCIACAMAGIKVDDGYEQWRNSEYRNERKDEE